MALRKQRLNERLSRKSVRLVLDTLTTFVPDDILLIRKSRLIDLLEQISHAIGLEPQRQIQLIRWHGFEIVGPIEVSRPVEIARTGGLEQPNMGIGGHVLRALEHHVFEQMRESRAAGFLIRRPDVIPKIHGHHRQAPVLSQDHFQTVGQRVFLERQPWDVGCRWHLILRRGSTQSHGNHHCGKQEARGRVSMHGVYFRV